MKLFLVSLTKHKFLALISLCILEIISFIVIFIRHKPIYLKIFDQTKEISIGKAINITNNINEIFKMSFIRYYLDMKCIGKHMSFFANNEINQNSKYYKNLIQDEDKHIIYGTIEELIKNFSEYYDYTTNKFLFLENYVKKFTEKGNNHLDISNDLMNNSLHPELNSIAYYKHNGNIYDIEYNLRKKTAAKYLISILKTNFLNRFLAKGEDFELIHYFLLMGDEIYIYPPEAYYNSLIYSIKDYYGCDNSFPECFFKYVSLFMEYYSYFYNVTEFIYPIYPITFYLGENSYSIQCLSIPFEEELDLSALHYSPKICLEMNMTKLFYKSLFKEKEAFHFLFFFKEEDELAVMFNNNFELFSEIKNVYNDPKFKEYYFNEYNDYFYLFQFLYLDLFKEPSLLIKHNISLDDIFQEYKVIKDKINEGIESLYITFDDYIVLDVEKTICKSDIYYNGKKCLKDNIMLIIYPLENYFNILDDNYVEYDYPVGISLYYSMTIIDTNNKYLKWKINKIVIFKILKLFFFFFISSIIFIYLFLIIVKIFFEFKFNTINQITQIIKGCSLFEIKDKNEIFKKKEKISIKTNNKEMLDIKNLFDYLIKMQLLKINFEQNEYNLNKKLLVSKETINNKNSKINNKNDSLNDYMVIIKNINNKEINIMLGFIKAYEYFKKGLYKLSEIEFKDLIKEIQIYENKILEYLENDYSKLKESISRCSKISYLNEYSLTNELSGTILHIIKVKLLSQKIYYLYALSLFNQARIIKKENSEKKYNNKKNIKKYEESIKYFNESKKISVLLGLDIIRQIFSLIMISKCYLELKNYKESMININEALLFYIDLRKVIKDKQYFNPKVMLFTENYIFQSILLTMGQITFNFNKYYESCWILMKMIETSPFVFDNIHFQVCNLLNNCLNQIDISNNIPFRQIDKYQNKINKMLARINARLLNKNNNINTDKNSNTNNNLINRTNSKKHDISISIENIDNNTRFKQKISKTKETYSIKKSSTINSVNHLHRNGNKNIILCISEKYIKGIKTDEFKYVLIKFFKKFFTNNNEEDKFSFIQFSYNGKKTISINSNILEIFLQKLESNKIAFKANNEFNKNYFKIQFLELSNLFMSIINSHKKINYENRIDNIIILFINTSDIRFNGQKECVDTINELNNNNYTVIIFTCDYEITEEKIEGIYSFINGLNDGYFINVRNYQQIKQVLMNLSVKISQEKFINYNYNINDYML